MISIKVPPLGESIVEATISRWTKKEGDAVAAGETLVELETDKITVEVPALKGGVLTKRLKNEGDVVKVDEALGELDETAAGATAAPSAPAATAAAAAPAAAAPSAATPTPAAPAAAEVKASPAAQRVDAEAGRDLGGVSGTGRGGMVTKQDVITAGTGAPAAPAPATERRPVAEVPALRRPSPDGVRETREKLNTRKRRMAEHLLNAKQATAMLTTFNEIDMTAVNAFRERHKDRIEKETGVRLSAMPFFVKAATLALKAHPIINSQLDGDEIVYHHYVNMGIAVASEAGLVVPNIKDADQMSLLDIARSIVAVAKKARDNKLTMDDLTGGTFTITNGGVFGSLLSTPIVNYPQAGILGLHKVQDRPVAVDGQVVIRPMMYVALSYDHRTIDGEQAVKFLVKIKDLMEDPAAMLV
ncbi:MAG TPA: 2-oxoglutarate dehydrogenase complex dihydrolipoyllysine-residue succinyltransferase [Gemmatimonadaceae bacterium]|nr:2-oxoglutarate dehydrogenase complex dihydrolipoyllysine-residue succinyltransferase [Gemmatimonadaceae bacterium]